MTIKKKAFLVILFSILLLGYKTEGQSAYNDTCPPTIQQSYGIDPGDLLHCNLNNLRKEKLRKSHTIIVKAHVESYVDYGLAENTPDTLDFGVLQGEEATRQIATKIISNTPINIQVTKYNMKNESAPDSYTDEQRLLKYALKINLDGQELAWPEDSEGSKIYENYQLNGVKDLYITASSQKFTTKAPGDYSGRILISVSSI